MGQSKRGWLKTRAKKGKGEKMGGGESTESKAIREKKKGRLREKLKRGDHRTTG